MKKIIIIVTVMITFFGNAQCWSKLVAGGNHCMALRDDGTLWAWGSDSYALGQYIPYPYYPGQIGTDTDWVYIEGGNSNSYAIKSNGTLWACGWNPYGQVGNGTIENQFAFVQIGTSTNWQIVSAGINFTAGLKADGTIWTWGKNEYGQLGDGTYVNKSAPIQVGTDTDWVFLATTNESCVAKKTDGTIWSWGRNNSGQLGIGSGVNKTTPTKIGNLNDWKTLFGGGESVFAIKNNDTVWEWGSNNNGQLGIGNTVNKSSPVQFGTATNWKSFSLGAGCVLALKNDNTLWGWGYNYEGQLGNGTNGGSSVLSPVQSTTDTNWLTVTVAYYFGAGLKSDNTGWCWGRGDERQLGDGNNVDVNHPIQVSCTDLNVATTDFANLITLYPNPTKSLLTIQNNSGQPIDSVTITDITGKKIMRQNASTINVENLQQGIYFIEVASGHNVYREKIIKE